MEKNQKQGLDPADCSHLFGTDQFKFGWIPFNYCPWCGLRIADIQRQKLEESFGDDNDCEKGGCAD